VSLLQVTVLAIVQGITEFLPISSSGHLALVPVLTSWPDQGLAMDVAVHVGTLFAVVLYFWRDVASAALGTLQLIGGRSTPASRLAFYLIICTIPVVIAGWFMSGSGYYKYLRSAEVIGWASIIFGVLLFVADRTGMTIRRMEHMTAVSALAIGLAQVLALIPGTSRAGITMTAARFLGFEPRAAAHFSMLMAIPVILAAGILEGRELYETGQLAINSDAVIAAALAFVTALASIAALMYWLRQAGFTLFVIYRIALGGGLLWWVYSA
jgi:undecaprenyl-diphosphatase